MHSTSVVSHLVSLRASAGNSAQLGARLSALIGPTSRTAGCLSFTLQHSMTEPDIWVLSGTWADRSAMNDWFSAPELKIFSDLMVERLVRSLDFQTFASVTAAQAQAAYVSPGVRMAG
ncbi:antibiotic biosynthesis monooxygenase family protein [Pseudomonas sp. NPDC088368]|jgi:quinol monooxygenase YgiN|uniref:antibiotic biosynthesis monooxygenase family protein n=1 Tax=Pseudomonas sp. NPDC088368 TaxID=3364453 RepID=UPI003822CDA3